jgi:hypothetical protein
MVGKRQMLIVATILTGIVLAAVAARAATSSHTKQRLPKSQAPINTRTKSPSPSVIPTAKPSSSPTAQSSPHPSEQPTELPSKNSAAPASPVHTLTPVVPISSYPTAPFTCYTYNWTSDWWIAYRYDVTPNVNGSQTVVYGGGSGHGNTPPPTSFPDMCAYNRPPTSTPAPSPVPEANYPDLSPH